MKQKYKNIFFQTTTVLNEQIKEIIDNGGIIDSIIPIQSVVYHTSSSDAVFDYSPPILDIDKICCQEVFVLYHKQ